VLPEGFTPTENQPYRAVDHFMEVWGKPFTTW